MTTVRVRLSLCIVYFFSLHAAARGADNLPPDGFTALFNGKDLSGWKGLVADPPKRAKMSPAELDQAQAAADERMRAHWKVEDGILVFDGAGDNLCTARDYGNFELLVDWKILPAGDSGIYLRGSPQVQIWDREEGSGGLFNNQKNPSKPIARSDRPVGEWNTFRIKMEGERVTVHLNGVLVTDTIMENYWERDRPIYPAGAIELQDHENPLYFKNIFVRELARADGPAAAEAPRPVLRKGARVAVTGDSITEQRRYSRFIEDYLLACLPELDLRVIQLGWSGERAPGFAARMANDLLPWKPDVVTTCYGMNDGQYRPYEPQIGQAYAQAMKDIVARLRAAGAVVVVGSPGAVDTYSFKRGDLPPAVYNANLAQLREIARGIATENGMPFANVHDAMVDAMAKAKPALGDAYDVCGGDGFHPNENGHLVMAYAFLKALGLDGDLGTITLDMKGSASAQDGHAVLSSAPGRAEIESRRYPFCSHGDYKSPSATRSILPFLRFDIELNRLTLRVKNLDSPRATVTWGAASRPFPREGLERGINLAAEFPDNPFSDAFRKVDEAVARKQAYETAMVKEVVTHFRAASGLVGGDAEAQKALETLRARLIAKHEALHAEARAAVAAVRHTIVVKAD